MNCTSKRNYTERYDYIVYDSNDMPVCIGKRSECVKYLNTSFDYFDLLVSRTKQGLIKKKGYRVYKIEGEL